MADVTELQHTASFVVDRYSPAEQPDGAVVTHAFPDAKHLPIASGFQGMVLKPTHWHD